MPYDPNNRRGKLMGYLTVYRNGETRWGENSTGQDREAFKIVIWRQKGNEKPVVNCDSARGIIPLWWSAIHEAAMKRCVGDHLHELQAAHIRSKNMLIAAY